MIHVYKTKHPTNGKEVKAVEAKGTTIELLKELSFIIWELIDGGVVSKEQMTQVLATAIAAHEPHVGEIIEGEGMKS